MKSLLAIILPPGNHITLPLAIAMLFVSFWTAEKPANKQKMSH
jgi:hypothetical protein